MENIKKPTETPQNVWDRTINKLNQITDKLGRPVDEDIKETITAFMVNKFPTYSSCGGHVEERFGSNVKISPYVGIGFDPPEIRFVGEEEIRKQIAAKYNVPSEEVDYNKVSHNEYWDYISKNNIPETKEYVALRKKNEDLQGSTVSLLEEFYSSKQPDERKLFIHKIGPANHFVISFNQEAPPTGDIKEDEIGKYRSELSAEQQEIKAFANFLKEKFYGLK